MVVTGLQLGGPRNEPFYNLAKDEISWTISQIEQLYTGIYAKFLCQKMVLSKRFIAVLFTENVFFSLEFVHNLTLSHMAYFVLFVTCPGVRLDFPMKKKFN